jgi:gliding motility-associated lipoprotein GldH
MLLNRNIFIGFLSLLLLLLCGCDSKRFFEENKSLQNGVWNVSHKVPFRVEIKDSVSRYDVYLNVRNDGEYPYSNLYLFIHTTLPGNSATTDTVECQLADPDGKWRGSGFGSIKFNRFLFQRGVLFPRKGSYLFELEQAMRVNDLKGIRDVGIRLEKTPR